MRLNSCVVRTPLNSIINYLEMALEDELDEQARSYLDRSLAASKSLVNGKFPALLLSLKTGEEVLNNTI
jgi:signal transduction histidine kinase